MMCDLRAYQIGPKGVVDYKNIRKIPHEGPMPNVSISPCPVIDLCWMICDEGLGTQMEEVTSVFSPLCKLWQTVSLIT